MGLELMEIKMLSANSAVGKAWNLMMEIPTRSSYYYAVEFGTLGFIVPTFL
jgi:hypothetical protein